MLNKRNLRSCHKVSDATVAGFAVGDVVASACDGGGGGGVMSPCGQLLLSSSCWDLLLPAWLASI